MGETKVCAKCGEEKEIELFTVRRTRVDGTPTYDNFCKTCRTAKTRANRHRTQFGFEDGEYDRLLEAQGGVCAICKRPPKKLALAVDHNHKTGETRGLVCHRCNRTLGWVFDDADVLEAAASYLRDPPAPRILGRTVIGLKGRVTRKKRGRKKKPGSKKGSKHPADCIHCQAVTGKASAG